jgi:DNA-binding NarL/FixJ family response regulator
VANTRVLVVDDHSFALGTLTAALAGRGIDVRGAATARDALALGIESRPSVALLDLDLGAGPTGIDLAHALRRALPAIGICILTGYRDPRLAGSGIPVLPIGSVYLCKADFTNIDNLIATITRLEHAPLSRRNPLHGATGPTVALTDMQMEVLLFVGEGATTAEIAERRGVSTSAVEQTIARICERLDIPKKSPGNQRVQLVHALYRLRGQASES